MGFNKRQIVALKRHNGHKNTPLTFNVVNITIKSERILNAFRYVTIPCFLRMFICIRVTHKTFICPNIFFIFYSFITIQKSRHEEILKLTYFILRDLIAICKN